MIVHVMRARRRRPRSARSWSRPIRREIAEAVTAAGGRAVMTRSRPRVRLGPHFRGAWQGRPGRQRARSSSTCRATSRCSQPADIKAALGPLADPAVDIATLALEITEDAERTDPNVVKAICSPVAPGRLRALYFTRATAPTGEGPLYHHIGLYAYRRAALARFVALPPSPLEQRERLEQLRALEAGMRIDVALTDERDLRRRHAGASGKGARAARAR